MNKRFSAEQGSLTLPESFRDGESPDSPRWERSDSGHAGTRASAENLPKQKPAHAKPRAGQWLPRKHSHAQLHRGGFLL
jgi:hypothetical protein